MNREIKLRVWDSINKEWGGSSPVIMINDNKMTIQPLPKTFINQFTGLKDKNGIEIYEGDIITDGIMKMVVKFQEFGGHMAFSGYSKMGSCAGITTSKVIGNIYENKELLK